MCSGPIRWSPPVSSSTPVDPEHVRADALDLGAERDEEAAEILDVRLAGGVHEHVSPSARATAAMIAFSVPITLASSRKMPLPAEPVGAQLVAVADRRRRRRARSNAWMCGSSGRRPITSPPGGGTLARAAAREQRAGEQERGADPLREHLVDLVRRELGGVDAHLVRARPLDLGAEVARAARASSRRRGSAGRSSARPARRSSRHAARIGSAPFLLPAARTRPLSGRPPSITNDSAAGVSDDGGRQGGGYPSGRLAHRPATRPGRRSPATRRARRCCATRSPSRRRRRRTRGASARTRSCGA